MCAHIHLYAYTRLLNNDCMYIVEFTRTLLNL